MSEPDMQLPPGKTCSDCAFFKRCEWLLSLKGTETACDWSPSVYRERQAPHGR